MTNMRFATHNISLRIGDIIIEPKEINEENIIKEAEGFNATKSLDYVADWINPELFDIPKVKAWFNMIISLEEADFTNFENRTIYLNHEAYQLTFTSPTTVESYNEGVIIDFSYDNSNLSRPRVDFGNNLSFNQDLFRKCKEYLNNKMKEVSDIEKALKSENLAKNKDKRSELLTDLVYKKYARFCAIKAVKRNLEVMNIPNEDESSQMQLQEVKAMYKDFMVPPLN